jgi:hypothetical protein
MLAFRTLLVSMWLVVAAITVWALLERGPLAAVSTFVRDLSHPWRAQYYSDFSAHLILLAAWILYREPSRGVGMLFALATLALGALFTLPYILVASLKARDAQGLLLGAGAAR